MSQWISVKERLPKYNEQVFAIVEHWNTKNRIPTALVRVDESDCDWRCVDGGKYYSELALEWTVLYWMPITPTPEENSQ